MATEAKAVGKAPDAFRTISEVAALLETPAHVLRFWESKFAQIRPVKRAGGRRYYRPDDIALLAGIKVLLHEQGMTIRGVQKLLRERGARAVAGLSALPWTGEAGEDRADALFDVAAEPPVEEEPAAATDPVIVGPWPRAPEAAEPARPGIVETFVAGTLARLSAETEGPGTEEERRAGTPVAPERAEAEGAAACLDGVARLRAALAGVDRERLRERAERIRPLVQRLRVLVADDAGATA